MSSRMLILMEKLPVSEITSLEFPHGIPKTDDASVQECVALITSKLAATASKHHVTGWKESGPVQWSVNPSKTAIVGTQEMTRAD